MFVKVKIVDDFDDLAMNQHSLFQKSMEFLFQNKE